MKSMVARVALLLTFAAAPTPAPAQTVVVPSPLTYSLAVELAASRSLAVEAARRQRAIREAAVRAAGQSPNPDFSAETSRDTPHQAINLDVPIEFGKRGRRIDLATEELSLAEVDVQAQVRAVRRAVREAFYSLVAADERVRIADSVLEIARRLRDAAEARFEAGAAPRLEVLAADLGVTRAETDLDLARSLRLSSQATLNGILDLPPQQALVVDGNLGSPAIGLSHDRAVAMAETANTDLLGLDRQIAVEQRRLDLLRAERVPTPVFSVGGLFNAPPEFDAGMRAGVSIGLPLFNRNQGEIAGSLATTSQLRARRAATARTIENAVFGALGRIDAQRRQWDAYQQRLVPTATDLASLSEESYRAGRTTVLGVLEAQRTVRDFSREALQAALELQFAIAELEELIGTALP